MVYSESLQTFKLKIFAKTLSEKCPNAEFFWSVFSCIHSDLLGKSPYSVRLQRNTDQKSSVFGHFSRSESHQLVSQVASNFQSTVVVVNLRSPSLLRLFFKEIFSSFNYRSPFFRQFRLSFHISPLSSLF